MARDVSRVYSEAFLELAREEQCVTKRKKEAEFLLQVLERDSEMLLLLNQPDLSQKEKTDCVKKIFQGRCSNRMLGFFLFILDNGRQSELLDILREFIKSAKQMEEIGAVVIVTSEELSKEKKEAIIDLLYKKTDYKKLEITYEVDKALIGGLRIFLEDTYFDFSLRTKLENMKNGRR